VPPLREMGTDRFLLLDHFRYLYARLSNGKVFSLTPEAKARWADYQFPGNARELRNIVIRLMAKHDGRPVSQAELDAELDSGSADTESAAIPRDEGQLLTLALRHLRESTHFSLDETLQRWESAYIAAAQQLTHGNVSQAAKLLGINRTTLYNRMEVLARSLGDTTETGSR
jgi:two-component system nitrogen regulation response regulator GlnG